MFLTSRLTPLQAFNLRFTKILVGHRLTRLVAPSSTERAGRSSPFNCRLLRKYFYGIAGIQIYLMDDRPGRLRSIAPTSLVNVASVVATGKLRLKRQRRHSSVTGPSSPLDESVRLADRRSITSPQHTLQRALPFIFLATVGDPSRPYSTVMTSSALSPGPTARMFH